MSRPDFTQRDNLRSDFCKDLIAGHGVEIGAGAFPQALPKGATASYYDLRDAAELKALFGTETIPVRPISELPSDFPSGADFLIAHNVLEHAPNPIGELVRWHSCVREGGVVVLSLPHYLYCPDAKRLVAPLSHLIEDYLNEIDGSDFVSREHGASFSLGWWDDICRSQHIESVEKFSKFSLDNLKSPRPDFHWHAYDSNLTIEIAMTAGLLAGTEIELLGTRRPELAETLGDILIAYRIVGRATPGENAAALVRLHAQRCAALNTAVDRVSGDVHAFLTAREPGGPRLRAFPLFRPFAEDGGFCFTTSIPPEVFPLIKAGMKVTVREDGQTLGPPDSLHQLIRDEGGGAFSVWGRDLYFSASDRSDCNRNGRQYLIVASVEEP